MEGTILYDPGAKVLEMMDFRLARHPDDPNTLLALEFYRELVMEASLPVLSE